MSTPDISLPEAPTAAQNVPALAQPPTAPSNGSVPASAAATKKPLKERFGECLPSLGWVVLLVSLGFNLAHGDSLYTGLHGNRTVFLMLLAGMFGAGGATVRILYAVLRDQESVAAHADAAIDPNDPTSPDIVEAQSYIQPIMMPFVGGFLAMVFELVASADLGLTIPQNGHAVAAWGAIIGLFFPQAMDKLKSVADALLGSASASTTISGPKGS